MKWKGKEREKGNEVDRWKEERRYYTIYQPINQSTKSKLFDYLIT